jgi:hypothetical protein
LNHLIKSSITAADKAKSPQPNISHRPLLNPILAVSKMLQRNSTSHRLIKMPVVFLYEDNASPDYIRNIKRRSTCP